MMYKTLMLQLYKPSKQKQALLDRAMANYAQGLEFLLEATRADVLQLAASSQKIQRRQLLALIDRELAKELNRFQVQPFKDSLKIDFAATAASYIARFREKPQTAYPKLRSRPNKAHAIYFGRYATDRNYCLLYDPYKDRFYAKLYLLNRAQSYFSEGDAGRLSLRHVAPGQPPLLNYPGKRRYLIFPLAMGKKQYAHLQKALEKPEILCTARLIKKEDQYFLMVNVDCTPKNPLKAETTMGVARAGCGGLHYTVCTPEGKIAASGRLDVAFRGSADPRQPFFILANQLVEIALRYRAQVILEAGGGKNDRVLGKRKRGGNPPDEQHSASPLRPGQYAEIARILGYKLPEKALPPPISVSANGLYSSCPRCGNRTMKNYLQPAKPGDPEVFACIECGFAGRWDANGSHNLALRLKKYREDKIPIYVKDTDDGRLFYNHDLDFHCRLPAGDTDSEKLFAALSILLQAKKEAAKDPSNPLLRKLRQYPAVRDAVRIVKK